MFIPVILGTAREGRQSEKVANYVLEQVKKGGTESELIDVRDFRIPATNKTGLIPEAKKLAEKVVRADALIIVSPEYNHAYPGELKMLLDLLYEQYFHKPVGLCGVSGGPLGGARGLQSLKLTLVALKMPIALEAVYFPQVQDLFDPQGKIKELSYDKKVAGLIAGLTELVKGAKQ
jgi:NAD(P)H-dependent FMN reductase